MQRVGYGEGIPPPDDGFYSSPLIDGYSTYGMLVPPPYIPQQVSPLWSDTPTQQPPPFVPQQVSPLWSDTPTQQPPLYGRQPASPIETSIIPSSRTTPVQKKITEGLKQRKKMTDEKRRNICLYHEEHKSAKDVDIAAIFGVERSTVSKILHKKKKNRNPTYGNQLLAKGTEDWPSDNGKCAMIEQSHSVIGSPWQINSVTKVRSGSIPLKSEVSESPTKDEARHALECVIKYLEYQPSVAADEYEIVNGIMKRFE